MKRKSYTDALIELETDMVWMKKIMSNHLASHTRYNILLVGAFLTTLLTLILTLITK